MDDTTKLILINVVIAAPIVVWVSSWIKTLYVDFKEQQKISNMNQEKLLDGLYDLKERVARLEEWLLGSRSKTIHTRPKDSDDRQ